jgi:hypothetical protein
MPRIEHYAAAPARAIAAMYHVEGARTVVRNRDRRDRRRDGCDRHGRHRRDALALSSASLTLGGGGVRALGLGPQGRDDVGVEVGHDICLPLQQVRAGMVAKGIGRPHVASERVHAIMPADIHHLEEIGPFAAAEVGNPARMLWAPYCFGSNPSLAAWSLTSLHMVCARVRPADAVHSFTGASAPVACSSVRHITTKSSARRTIWKPRSAIR